jgi:hypothetical protein
MNNPDWPSAADEERSALFDLRNNEGMRAFIAAGQALCQQRGYPAPIVTKCLEPGGRVRVRMLPAPGTFGDFSPPSHFRKRAREAEKYARLSLARRRVGS